MLEKFHQKAGISGQGKDEGSTPSKNKMQPGTSIPKKGNPKLNEQTNYYHRKRLCQIVPSDRNLLKIRTIPTLAESGIPMVHSTNLPKNA